MNELELFFANKEYLFSIAYRITGSYQDTEDILQETYLRFQKQKIDQVLNLRAYLGKIVAHLAFDLLKNASRRKETYIGPYLPEPIPERREGAEDEQIDYAFLVILESLNPIERAVYILREAFDFEFQWISEVVGKNTDNCRQILKRAKTAIKKRKSKFEPTDTNRSKLIDEFLFACYTNDPTKLTLLLKEEIVSYSDGGGKVHAARIPIAGLQRTIKFLIKTSRNAGSVDAIFFTYANGKKSIVGYKEGSPIFLQYLKIGDNRISEVYTILNPEKLRAFNNHGKLLEAGLLQRLTFLHFIKFFLWRFISLRFFYKN